ncbi:unnamed protein product [Ilex paraguariensis]|uniref:RNase H type-1 domain-containing protein n=1 Tax=Ilex paraguariensis TaxID=185542 RepID=A0ABC8UDC7_9AQUA
MVAAFCQSVDCILKDDHIEAMAASVALKIAIDMGLRSVILEGDSKTLIDSISCKQKGSSDIGKFVDQIQLCAQLCDEFSTSRLRRPGNNVAHILVNYAKIYNQCCIWRGKSQSSCHLLSCLMYLVLNINVSFLSFLIKKNKIMMICLEHERIYFHVLMKKYKNATGKDKKNKRERS